MKKEEVQSGLESKLGTLGALVDFQLQLEKAITALKIRNTHLTKNGSVDPHTKELLLESIKFKREFLLKPVKRLLVTHPAYPWFSRVKGIGNENISKVITLIDIAKAPTISSLWKYAGFSVIEGKANRPQKGKKLDFNKELKVMCWRVGVALIKANHLSKNGTKFGRFFKKYLEEEKAKFERDGKKVIPTKDWKKIAKNPESSEDFRSEYYVQNRAFRRMIKLFLGCLWLFWRKAEGLAIRDPYPIEKMGHTTLIKPEEMIDR